MCNSATSVRDMRRSGSLGVQRVRGARCRRTGGGRCLYALSASSTRQPTPPQGII